MSCTDSDSDMYVSDEEEAQSALQATGHSGAEQELVVVTIDSDEEKQPSSR